MIYTVTFNPSLDYVVDVKDFKLGIVNRTVQETIFPGGKGINVSMVLKNLGYNSTALGFTAGFVGNEIIRLLNEKGVDTDFIPVEKGVSRINVKLRSNEESEINGQGPKIEEADIKKLYKQLDGLSEGDVLVLAGSIPNVMPSSMYMDIMDFLKEKKHCDVVIALTHIGFDTEGFSDPSLVRSTRNVDIVVGGHSHTFLKDVVYEKNLDGKEVPIVQDGCWGLNFGQLDVYKK